MTVCPSFLAGLALLFAALPAPAQQPPSYVKQVKPFLGKFCVECHNPDKLRGDLDVSTVKALIAGGKSGASFIPGKPDESYLVTLAEGKDNPKMPPKTAKAQPAAADVAILRAWVAAGAKDDTGTTSVALPETKPHEAKPAPVAALAYRPGAKPLAAGGQNEVVLIDPATGEVTGRLTGQDGKVTALAFSRDGGNLAVASGTPGASGVVRVYFFPPSGIPINKPEVVISAHKDVILGLAFSPDGNTLATCGYDRLIKLWDAGTGKERRTLKDHSDSVYSVAFSPDGKLLASGGADRAVKVWDVTTGTRLYTLGESTDWVYAIAWHPDGKHLAAGGVDKSIRVWEASAAGGKVVQSVFAHAGAVTRLAYSADGSTLYSLSEDRTAKAWTTAKMQERTVYPKQPDTALDLAVRGDGKQLALGRYDGAVVLLDEATGKVQSEPLPVKPKPPEPKKEAPAPGPADPFPQMNEAEPNDTPTTAQPVTLPVSIHGSIGKAGDVDYFRFEAKAGQEVGVQALTAAIGSKLEPVLLLTDATGKVLVESTNGLLGYTCPRAATYALGIRDRDYRGGPDMPYRLHVGDLPIVTSVFPLGLQRGTEKDVVVSGVNLGGVKSARVKAPADATPGTRLPVSITPPRGVPLGNPAVVVGEFPEVQGSQPAGLTPPFTANGSIVEPGASETWAFAAKKGQRLVLEVNARRLGSPLDSVIEILDAKGQPVPRAVLRCVAKTNIVFRDHDSAGSGIRIETWSELRINDYLYVGGELLRIRELPKNPDDDCQFWSAAGQRLGWLDTTPTHHPLGEAMYKVTMHAPGTTFPPNGFPVITLPYRNDDGGPGYGKDSRLVFDPPADGEYRVRVSDARGQGGSGYGYRLTVRPPRPDFRVSFSPTAPAVWKGGAVPVSVNVERLDDFDGRVDVNLENVPPGFSAPASNILGEDSSTAVALSAEPTAANPAANAAPLKIVARAVIDGKEVLREATGGRPQVIDGGDVTITTEQSEVTVRPGGETRLTVKVERHNGFAGRIPLDVRGLPHGVRVLDIGLNGILITEKETTRTIVIYAEPWVEPAAHPCVVLARSERKGTEHAATSVLLKVAPAAGK
ncbi:MAG TPA: c-type cytochrome domain-containing protein [Gemmataceae bacterium]|nr:c-type cytochrome domain-containing protein [Gemmataceae bacterium]